MHESLEKGTRSEAQIENQAKNQPVGEGSSPRPLSRARLSSYSGMRKASVAHKTTRLLPMLDPLVLSTEMMTLTHHLPKEKYLKIQRKGRKSQHNFRADP